MVIASGELFRLSAYFHERKRCLLVTSLSDIALKDLALMIRRSWSPLKLHLCRHFGKVGLLRLNRRMMVVVPAA